jgi:hypothetical protein
MLTINGQTLPATQYERRHGTTGSGEWWEARLRVGGHVDLFRELDIAEGMPATCDLGEGRLRLLSWSRPSRQLMLGEVNPVTGKQYTGEYGFSESCPGDHVYFELAVLSERHPDWPTLHTPLHQPRETEGET